MDEGEMMSVFITKRQVCSVFCFVCGAESHPAVSRHPSWIPLFDYVTSTRRHCLVCY